MAATPSNYGTSTISRDGTLISELNIITARPYNGFINKWKFVPYIMMNELAGNELATKNKEFYWYEAAGRHMGFVTANATVAGAAGAAVVVTIKAGGYSAGGTKSLPEIGLILYNSRTGVESRVTAVNKGTDSAHTFTIVPVVASQSAAVNADDELQSRGFKYVGAGSDRTQTIVQNIDKYTNYCTQLRTDSTFEDLSLAEAIDFEYEGKKYYKYKQLADDNQRFMLEKELMLMDSNLTDNLGYDESGSAGLIQQVQANGLTDTYTTFGLTTTIAEIERKLDAQGAPGEYDWLSDINQTIDIQNALGTEFTNGAIVYAQSGDMGNLDLKRGFKSFTPYNRTYNFTRYSPFSNAAFYGGTATGTRNNFGLLIPKNSQVKDAKTKNLAPQFCIRYQEIPGFGKVVIGETGALSANGKTSKMELNVFQEAHYGVQIMAANQYLICSK